MRCRTCFVAVAAVLVTAGLAQAQSFLNLDPGVTLTLFSSNSNDGYSAGRGVVIQANSAVTIVGVGLWTQPPVGGFTPTWTVWQTTAYPSSNVDNILLQTASPGLQADAGLGFYNTALTPFTLVPGNLYHFEITYTEATQQNWFYNFDQGNVNLGPVSVLDGTQAHGTSNFVMPDMHLQLAAVPEPTTFALMGITGMVVGGGLWIRRKRKLRSRR